MSNDLTFNWNIWWVQTNPQNSTQNNTLNEDEITIRELKTVISNIENNFDIKLGNIKKQSILYSIILSISLSLIANWIFYLLTK